MRGVIGLLGVVVPVGVWSGLYRMYHWHRVFRFGVQLVRFGLTPSADHCQF